MTRRSLPLSTLHPGEVASLSVTGRSADSVTGWTGQIVAVDQTAVRLRDGYYSLGFNNISFKGERVIPWIRIQDVKLHQE